MQDIGNNGKVTDWQGKKLRTLELADSYKRLGEPFLGKHYRVKECGTFLEFKRFLDNNTMKLNQANFCKVRLCPMCSWRRSLKIYGQTSKVMDKLLENGEYEFLFLTLTSRNVFGEDLNKAIDELLAGFNRMTKRKIFKDSIKGYFRALEVTHNLNIKSDWFDSYHPHFHIILVVNKSYFTDKNYYLNQREWTKLWKDVLRVNYTPIVHVKRFRDTKGIGIEKSLAETAKYTVKSDDYIIKDDVSGEIIETMTDEAVYILDIALANRRLTSYGGILKDIHKKLRLDDIENGDLINTDNEEIRDDLNYMIERYSWNVGYKQHLRIE